MNKPIYIYPMKLYHFYGQYGTQVNLYIDMYLNETIKLTNEQIINPFEDLHISHSIFTDDCFLNCITIADDHKGIVEYYKTNPNNRTHEYMMNKFMDVIAI